MNWDIVFFQWINELAENESLLGRSLTLSSAWGDVFFFLSLTAMLLHPNTRKAGVYGFAAAAAAVFASRFVSLFYYRDRPFVMEQFNALLYHIESNSFPSDHAAAAFGISVALRYCSKPLGRVYIGFAALVAFSRIWVGVHFPFDVAAGAAIGALAAAALCSAAAKHAWYERGAEALKAVLRREGKQPPMEG